MKKILLSSALFAVLAISFGSCGNHPKEVRSSSAHVKYNVPEYVKYDVPKYVDPDWENIEIQNTQCIQNQWMSIPVGMSQDSFIVKLVDAYNASVVWHSVKSDMEMFWRWDCYTDTAMLGMDLSKIKDKRARLKAKQLIECTAAGQRDSTIDVNNAMNQYLSWLSDYFNISHFFNTDSITDEVYWAATDKANWIENYASMEDMRGKSDSIYQQQLLTMLDTTTDFNVYCILAIEYAHSSIDGPHMTNALPYLVKALTAGIYSPMLREVWRTWRAIMTSDMGQSRDSDIPNAEYNQLRMISCYTMLCYIHDNPTDWLAVNNFLVTSYIDNICRYGTFPLGNQGMMDRVEVFPEWAERILNK